MNSEDILVQLLKEKYEYELKRKYDYDNALSIPITIMSALFAGMYFVSSDANLKSAHCFMQTIMWILLILLCMSCILTLVMLFVVYFGFRRRYSTFPDSDVVVNVDYKSLKEYASEHFKDSYDETLTKHMNDRVIKWYLDSNTNNTSVNDRRGDALFYARLFICIGLSIGLVLLILVSITKAIQ